MFLFNQTCFLLFIVLKLVLFCHSFTIMKTTIILYYLGHKVKIQSCSQAISLMQFQCIIYNWLHFYILQSMFSLSISQQQRRLSLAVTLGHPSMVSPAPTSSIFRLGRLSCTPVWRATSCWVSQFSTVSLGTHRSGVGCHLFAKVRNCSLLHYSVSLAHTVCKDPALYTLFN